MKELNVKVWHLRQTILDIIMTGGCGHIGGDMGAVNLLAVLFSRMNVSPDQLDDPDRDRFVLSKSHCVEALYAVWADRKLLKLDEILKTYSKFGSEYIGHPHNTFPGIDLRQSAGIGITNQRDDCSLGARNGEVRLSGNRMAGCTHKAYDGSDAGQCGHDLSQNRHPTVSVLFGGKGGICAARRCCTDRCHLWSCHEARGTHKRTGGVEGCASAMQMTGSS